MKKAIATLLSLAIVISTFLFDLQVNAASLEKPQLVLSQADVMQGDIFTTTLYFEKYSSVSAANFTFAYNPEYVELISCVPNEDCIVTPVIKYDIIGQISISIASGTNISAKMPLIDVSFKANDDLAVGKYDLLKLTGTNNYVRRLDNDNILQTVEFDYITSDLNIYSAGDINLDGKVDGSDAVYMLRYEAGLNSGKSDLSFYLPYYENIEEYNEHQRFILRVADAYYDGTVNGSDAVSVLRHEVGFDETLGNRTDVIFYDENGKELIVKNVIINEELKKIPEVPKKDGMKGMWSLSSAEYEEPDFGNVSTKLKLYPYYIIDKCDHTMQRTVAKTATCTEDGNIEYWYCEKCNEYFADGNGNDVITLDYTVIKAKGHTYSKEWSYDNTYHWHDATCGHSDIIADKSSHTFNSNHICEICGAIDSTNWKLSTPVIEKVEYDTVYWNAVENADYYTVCVNDNYECTLRGTSCNLAEAKWNGNTISQYGTVKITVQAIGHDGYETSAKSAVNNTYFYVPETKSADANKLIGYSIGFGYNVVEDEYLDITQCSDKSVFNVGKLLTIGNYTARNHSGGTGTAYNYKSIDEFVSKTKVSFEYGQTVGCALLGSLKTQINADVGFDFKKYAYNETFVYEYNLTYKDHIITNFSDDNLLAYCLSNDFLKDIRKESVSTKNMSDDQLVEYLYNTYGTHAILGITTGGSYSAKYNISTNSQDISAKVELGFSTSTAGGGALDQIIQKDFNIDASVSEEIQSSTSETKADFSMSYNGGNGGAATSPSDVSGAVSKWSSSISEDNAVSIKFTENGAISIATVLSYIDGNLSSKFANYINGKADETYYTLFGIYNKSANLPVSVETVDNQNILIINISGAQNGGDIRQYSYPNLVDGVFTVYPVMCNRNIDGVRIIGAYDEYQNLINSFSLKLAQQWKNQSINIILENVGILTTNENGLIDLTNLPFDVDVEIEYIGQNEIVAHDATAESVAQCAIIANDLTIKSSDADSQLVVRGGNGLDGVSSDEDGTDGAIAIIVDTLKVNTTGEVIVYGGNGGNGADGKIAGQNGYNGANGATGILSKTVNFEQGDITIIGGCGGNGGYGAQGIRPTTYDDCWGTRNAMGGGSNGSTGGRGGAGGNGGKGGFAVIAESISTKSSSVILTGGNSGNAGDGGKGGTGGTGQEAGGWGATAGNGGNGGVGGNGGNTYNGSPAIILNGIIPNDISNLLLVSGSTGKIGYGGLGGDGGSKGYHSANHNHGQIATWGNNGNNGSAGEPGSDGTIIS